MLRNIKQAHDTGGKLTEVVFGDTPLSAEARDLLERMLALDPTKRIRTQASSRHRLGSGLLRDLLGGLTRAISAVDSSRIVRFLENP